MSGTWEYFGEMLCVPKDAETRRRAQALQVLLQLYDPTVAAGGDIGPETLAATNRLGFNFETCKELVDKLDDVIISLGAVVIDETGKPQVPQAVLAKAGLKTSGLPWWAWLAIAAGGVAVYNYTRPKSERWF